MDAMRGANGHGARRITDHAIIGPLDDGQAVAFTFDALPVTGRDGEPIASALLAAGHRVFRTMPDQGDPRGCYCFVGRCSDCLVVVDGVPGVRSCVTPVREGMAVQTHHALGHFAETLAEDNDLR